MTAGRLMTAADWARLQEIFAAASDLPPEARPKFLDEACGRQTRLRAQVESLLGSLDEDGGITSAVENAVTLASSGGPAPGEHIGSYEIIRLLGRGGMGAVYLASRADDQYRKEVAIKLIPGGVASPDMMLRFRAERQILANLEHPNIARLLDGGATSDGSPYVVMEYVAGKAADRYCADKHLGIRDRLRLFQPIARAVQYAHQNVIVHRDIKPANILVTDAGEPKLLDFGIAKLLAPDYALPAVTQAGDRLMTPEYASPEQIRGEPITTSTDVYSLGVLLYQLLAGQPPFRLTGTLGQLERDICERVPERPSRVARSRELEGDLDRIVLKALHKEPNRRYVSAAEFSADIERYLTGYPVIARPDSWRYRASKFTRRHRIGAAASVGFLGLVIAFGIGMAVLARKAREEARTASQVTDFLINLFQSNDPGQTKGDAITTRELLDRGAARIEGQLQNDPVVQARLLDTVGALYDTLGMWPQGESLLKKALALREHKLPRDDLAIANTLHELGSVSSDLDQFDQAERSYQEALRLYQAKLGRENLKVAESLDDVGTMLFQRGHNEEAEKLFRQSLDINSRLAGAKAMESMRALNNLSVVLSRRGDYVEAERLTRQLVALATETGGRYQDSVGYGWHNMAVLLDSLGRFPEAEAAIGEAIAIRTRLYGKDHPLTAASAAVMSHILTRLGRFDEAKALADPALAHELKSLGPRNLDTAYAQDCLASVRLAQGDAAQARQLFQSALQARVGVVGPAHAVVADSWVNLGNLDKATGDLPAAVNEFQSALEIRKRTFGANSIFSAEADVALAEVLIGERNFARAEDLAREALSADQAGYPARHIAIGAAESALGWAYLQQGRSADARPLLEDAYAIAQGAYGVEHPESTRAGIRLADCLAASGDRARAAALVEIAGPRLDRSLDPTWHAERRTLQSLRQALRLSPGPSHETSGPNLKQP
jgi:serine/threonine-protein kinase